MSVSGPLLPIQHVRCEVGSPSKSGPLVLGARLSHLDLKQTFAMGRSGWQVPLRRSGVRVACLKDSPWEMTFKSRYRLPRVGG
jgi:hypothetical protein